MATKTTTKTCNRCSCSTVNLEQDKCNNCGTPFAHTVLGKLVVATEALVACREYAEAAIVLKSIDRFCNNRGFEMPEDVIALNIELDEALGKPVL